MRTSRRPAPRPALPLRFFPLNRAHREASGRAHGLKVSGRRGQHARRQAWRIKAAYGSMPCESYAAVLQAIEQDAVCDLAFPADEGANLPDPAGLSSYDGVVLTGSALNLYDRTPAVTRQIDLMRAVYASRHPGLRLVLGHPGRRRSPRAATCAETQGAARSALPGGLRRREAGRVHPMLAGRPPAYDAPAIHLDIVATAPAGLHRPRHERSCRDPGGRDPQRRRHLLGRAVPSGIQLGELAVILERRVEILVAEGFCDSLEDAAAYVADLIALARRTASPISPGATDSTRRCSTRHGAPARSAISSRSA